MAEDEKKEGGISPEDKTLVFGAKGRPAGLNPPYLVVVDGPRRGARYPLQKGGNVIGRLDECHVVLDDMSVSRKHAELNLEGEEWKIKDLKSKNQTFVNGAPALEPVVIGHKDLIRVGLYILRFVARELDPNEEMDLPAEDVGEWGTVMVSESGENPEEHSETARLNIPAEGKKDPLGKDITSPHSPLERDKQRKSWLPKARLVILLGVLFSVALLAGLYFYWELVLTPKDVAKKEPVKGPPRVVKKAKSVGIPLGPPLPQKPATVPLFLDCVANPFPATVRFQGKEIGKTPLKISVELEPEKSYTIEAEFVMPEMNETYRDTLNFEVKPDQSMVSLLFRAPVGTIKVTSLPRDVSFYLEAYFEYDRFQGRPVKLANLVLNKPIYAPYGRYVLELRQPKEVGEPGNIIENIVFRREFVLREEEPAFVLDVDDQKLKSFPVEIRSTPSGADVFVNQIRLGTTPFKGELLVGKHILTLRKEGYFETTEEISMEVNIPYKKEITLLTSKAGEKINLARARMNQGLYQEAVQSLSEVFDLGPTDQETAETRYLLGNLFLGFKDYSKALGYFEQAKGHESFKYWGLLGISAVFADQQEIDQALHPLVEVLLNAKDEEILKEANNLLGKISPLRSVVYIRSEPPGAQVFLNEKKLEETTPVLLHEMGLGSYKVRLEKPGFQTLHLTLNLSVNEFKPVLAKLKPVE